MSFDLSTLILLPIGLGLLGFLEPCTIGGHLLFLETQRDRLARGKMSAVTVFIITRSLVTGFFGGLIAYLGQFLIEVQTGMWLVFGLIYLTIGLAFLAGRSGLLRLRIDFAPARWKKAASPLVLGLAFGLNIPACAAPVLFGLLGLAATTGTVATGFAMMFLFGFFLSLPLVIFAAIPNWAQWLDKAGQKLKQMRIVIGILFVVLGIWSIWFGIYVDPANWVGGKS